MSNQDIEVCVGCNHWIGLHYEDVRKTVRCMNIESGTSTSGIIGLPWERRCDCTDYRSEYYERKLKRGKSFGFSVSEEEAAEIRARLGTDRERKGDKK